VITCVVEYVIEPARIEDFERFAAAWMTLVNRHGGTHHGYFLPAEGASDQAEALFSFESLAAYERYREHFGTDPEFAEASKSLAANQGLYNGFLVAGLVWGLVADKYDVTVFFLLCVIVAGLYGAATVSRKILVVQALPAVVALVLVVLAH